MRRRLADHGTGGRSSHRRTIGDLATILVAILALASVLPFETVTVTALGGLTVLLIGWPAGLLAVLVVRWARKRDFRFAGLALALVIVATLSAAGSVLLSR